MDIRYGRDLKKGDLIGVCYNNYIRLGIYNKQASKGNTNFWLLKSVLNWKNSSSGKIYTDFINRTDKYYGSPIVKIAVDQLTNENDQQDYLEASSYLKQKGYI